VDSGRSATDVIQTKLTELEAVVYAAEPGTLSADSDTVRFLEFYLHWLPVSEQRQWFVEHGEALRRAVFG
jgi:hypothetical protein